MKPASRKILIDILAPYLLPGEALRETGQAVCYIPAGGGGDAMGRRYLGCPSHLGTVLNVIGWLEPVQPGSTTCIFEYKSERFGGAGWEARMAAEFLRLTGLGERDLEEVRRARAAAKRERLTQRLASLETELAKLRAELGAIAEPTPEPPSVPVLPPNASAEVRAFAADIAAAADALSWEEIERRSAARFPTPKPAASGWRWEQEASGWLTLVDPSARPRARVSPGADRTSEVANLRRLLGPDVPALPGVPDV